MRLIDADKLWEAITTRIEEYCDLADLIEIIETQATEDAEPVRYGRWIEVDVGDCCYRCSECGFIRDAYLLDIGNYCPQCGAKMGERK